MRSLYLWGILFFVVVIVACTTSTKDSDIIRISSKQGQYQTPRWSLDGTQILFQFRPQGSIEQQFVLLNSDGTNWSTLPIPPDSIPNSSSPHWIQPDEIVYVRRDPLSTWNNTRASVALFSLSQKMDEELISDRNAIIGLCSNMGEQFIAFIENTNSNILDGRYILKAYFIENKEIKNILIPNAGDSIVAIVCSHEGGKIAVAIGRVNAMRVEIIDIKTNERIVLFSPKQLNLDSLVWSHDDEWIAVRTFGDTPETKYQAMITLVRTDGSEIIKLDLPSHIFPVDFDWSPVDNRLVVTSLDGVGKYSMHVINLSRWLD
ncbi:MAG: hypothetical protein KJ063_20875 [Anaerolineae bacterium]|nr:hypothetical protein [Anaerolineae bacterium]